MSNGQALLTLALPGAPSEPGMCFYADRVDIYEGHVFGKPTLQRSIYYKRDLLDAHVEHHLITTNEVVLTFKDSALQPMTIARGNTDACNYIVSIIKAGIAG